MGKKRFYDAVRDLIRDVHDPPEQPSRSKRRLSISISSLLAAPQTCAACWEPTSGPMLPFCCHLCLAVLCTECLVSYARAGLSDRGVLPLRCAHMDCRAPVPLSALRRFLSLDDLARLTRFQCEVFRRGGGATANGDMTDTSDPNGMQRQQTPNADMMEMEGVCVSGHDEMDVETAPITKLATAATTGTVGAVAEPQDGDGEQALLSLMGTEGWQRCPECGMCIERTSGCPHMVCVCGGEFCYSCGDRWSGNGLGCPRRCGFPVGGDDVLLTLLPGRFDELREELWQRFTALLQTFRNNLDRLEGPRRMHGDGILEGGPPPYGGRTSSRGSSRGSSRSSVRSSARTEGRLAKMRLRSLVHRENRF